jgi:putative transposase
MNGFKKGQAPHSKDLRKGRASAPGQIYLVTTVTLRREPVFADLSAARKVIHCLRQSTKLGRSETLAYVLMPDHLHWLVQLAADFSLSRVVGDVKSISSRMIGRPVWQSGFHDHAVRKEEDLLGLARYIVANPLRSGVVEDIGCYSHWDTKWL